MPTVEDSALVEQDVVGDAAFFASPEVYDGAEELYTIVNWSLDSSYSLGFAL